MADSTAGLGGFSLIVKNEGRFISKSIVALGLSDPLLTSCRIICLPSGCWFVELTLRCSGLQMMLQK